MESTFPIHPLTSVASTTPDGTSPVNNPKKPDDVPEKPKGDAVVSGLSVAAITAYAIILKVLTKHHSDSRSASYILAATLAAVAGVALLIGLFSLAIEMAAEVIEVDSARRIVGYRVPLCCVVSARSARAVRVASIAIFGVLYAIAQIVAENLSTSTAPAV